MSEGRIRTAVMGLDETGRRMLEELLRLERRYEAAAVADTDAEIAQAVARKHQLEWFDDYRQLIVQEQIDLLLVAAPLFSCAEYVYAAMKKGCHVLKLAPAGRDFDEALRLLNAAKESGVFFDIARWWRFSPCFEALREYVHSERDRGYYLLEARVTAAERQAQGWENDPQLAGGGALMYQSYPLIDRMVTAFSLPQQVYGICTNRAPDRTQRRLLTEEAAVAAMRFDDQLAGSLVAGKTIWPGGWQLCAYGRGVQLRADGDGFAVRDDEGNVVEEVPASSCEEAMMSAMLENFHDRLLNEDCRWPGGDSTDMLNNMAFVQAVYLSNKTGTAEEPSRILQMAGVVGPNP